MIKPLSMIWAMLVVTSSMAQNNFDYWQQHVDYKMSIDMDVENWQYKGTQELRYTNNSPDTLQRVFYHLYFNAFQPGSEMDIRSQTLPDPDLRTANRISDLSPSEIGYIHPKQLLQDGKKAEYEVSGTVMEVQLNKPILPGQTTTFQLDWDAQVPLLVRRSGRTNEEGVALSMAQWYPKMAEYDFQGWHAEPYIENEFFGVWGDFDVKITLDTSFMVGGTGYLKNKTTNRNNTTTWQFEAPRVHDFTWAADPDYIHETRQGPNGVTLNFYYQDDPKLKDNWEKIQDDAVEIMEFFNEKLGPYPYKQYSIIQGGDGGMEYGMCTLITGDRMYHSLVSVVAHEMAHSWFQFVLATNESLYEWMDEGFTTYVSDLAEFKVLDKNFIYPFSTAYDRYAQLARSGLEQPLSTHADRYISNSTYTYSAYYKGAVFLAQLEYVIGKKAFEKTLKRYFKDWAFKHPTPNDLIRVAEKESQLELDWYLQDFTQTTAFIDYGIKSVEKSEEGRVDITLERLGLMPMPIDVYVTYQDGSQEAFYMPLRMMRGEKENPFPEMKRTVLPDWAWAYPTYSFSIDSSKEIKTIEIDKTRLIADIDRENNVWSSE